ncbi:hypothetical protein STEG23_014170, partial [Scotinomys teguina]
MRSPTAGPEHTNAEEAESITKNDLQKVPRESKVLYDWACSASQPLASATLGLNVTSVKMAKVDTQHSQPSPTHCSVKTTGRDLDHIENGLS